MTEREEIKNWFRNLKFKKKLFGGIDEADVWAKFQELNQMYEKLLIEELAVNSTDKQSHINSIMSDSQNG